jgi:pilus assembly protein Flp/PilA
MRYEDTSVRNPAMALLRLFLHNDSGATAIEYALIAVLVSVAAVGAMTALGGKLTDTFTSVANQFK